MDLSDGEGRFAAEWFNPRSGERTGGGEVQGGAKRELRAPFEGDAVLYIAAGEGSR